MRYLPAVPRNYKGVILAGIVVLALLGFSAIFGSRGVLHLHRLRGEQRAAEAVAFRLADENRTLREHLRRVEHDDTYLEKLARERLGWIKPGELVYRLRRHEAPVDGHARSGDEPGDDLRR